MERHTIFLVVTFENHSYIQGIDHIKRINQNSCYNTFMAVLFLSLFIPCNKEVGCIASYQEPIFCFFV